MNQQPVPSSAAVSKRMQRQATRDTAPEVALRKALHRRGIRFRLHRRIVPEVRRTADIVLPSARICVDVRGCYWHGCPQHRTMPKANAEWWAGKLEGNVARDVDTERRWREAGWTVVVVWEHEDPEAAAERIASLIPKRVTPRS